VTRTVSASWSARTSQPFRVTPARVDRAGRLVLEAYRLRAEHGKVEGQHVRGSGQFQSCRLAQRRGAAEPPGTFPLAGSGTFAVRVAFRGLLARTGVGGSLLRLGPFGLAGLLTGRRGSRCFAGRPAGPSGVTAS